MFEPTTEAGVLQLRAPGTRWLSTGYDGGYHETAAAYNVSVPEGWTTENLDAYVGDRLASADFDVSGPALLTGVDLDHARGARLGSVVVYATAGVSNPATLPVADVGTRPVEGPSQPTPATGDPGGAGTVNLLVGTTRPLTDGALATLVGTAVEAKTATLQALAGFTGTTTDAVVVGTPVDGERDRWAGSGTTVGNATRVCVRDALRGSLRSRYAESALPDSVDAASHGVVTGGDSDVFEL